MRLSRLSSTLEQCGRGPFLKAEVDAPDPAATVEVKVEQKDDKPEGVTPEVAAYFGKVIAAERKAAADKAKQDAKDEAERKAQADADAKKVADDEAKGEYEAVKETLTKRATDAEAERETLKTKADRLEAVMKTSVDADWKLIPEDILSFYTGAEDDVLARYEFMQKPAVLKAIEAKRNPERKVKGHQPDPPRGGEQNGVESERRALAANPNYRPM